MFISKKKKKSVLWGGMKVLRGNLASCSELSWSYLWLSKVEVRKKREGVTLKRNKERRSFKVIGRWKKIGHWKLILIIYEAYCYTEASWELGQAGMLGMVTINSQPQPQHQASPYLSGWFFSGGGTGVSFSHKQWRNSNLLVHCLAV